MSARDDILGAIRAQRVRSAPRPPQYVPPSSPDDLVRQFTEHARAIHAEVRVLESESDIAGAVADLLRAKNLPAAIHAVPDMTLPDLGAIEISSALPGPDDAAVTRAPFAIAETGTLAYPARADAPAAWHFRPGFEIAILRASDILPHMENVIARVKAGTLPHTINFVSGPSRTADVEQTLELGAHGPKALAILIIRD
ncbi:MAG TPA: LUD domain-containing protein [Rhizomicrobium sp.]|jgi:L-lactate dehydrogenase complex protein LldG|nr:LUD domain-containing protein [Rhizomicrobium sp.]